MTLLSTTLTIFPGASNKLIHGIVGPDANAVALGVAGDDAYWLVPALTPEHDDPHSFDYSASSRSPCPYAQSMQQGISDLRRSIRCI